MRDLATIIPSKDRALQLDGLLRSYRKHCGAGAPLPVVIYKATTDQHAAQYARLATEYPPNMAFEAEVDFFAQVHELLYNATNALLLVDDSVFVRPVDLEVAQSLIVDPRMIGASLRLGRNATWCYTVKPSGAPQETPKLMDGPGGWHCFDWAACAKEDAALIAEGKPMRWLDWAYPFDVSSTLFRTETLLRALDGKRPPNPNVLEATLAEAAPRFADESPFLACLDCSACFAIPGNKVQDVYNNRAG